MFSVYSRSGGPVLVVLDTQKALGGQASANLHNGNRISTLYPVGGRLFSELSRCSCDMAGQCYVDIVTETLLPTPRSVVSRQVSTLTMKFHHSRAVDVRKQVRARHWSVPHVKRAVANADPVASCMTMAS